MTKNNSSTRELRFRAWYEGEMIFSDCAVGEFEFAFDVNGNMEFNVWNDEMHKLTPDGDVTYSGWDTYTTDIMQYIGYADINKVDIYEDDILKDLFNRILLVERRRGGFCFKAITKTNFVWAREIDQWFEYDSPRPLIIGNVHDNPDLLGDGSE